MPNIKKVLANVAQTLTDAEKTQARDNIGISKYTSVAYDNTKIDYQDAIDICMVGDSFKLKYYTDNNASLRLCLECMEFEGLHDAIVSYGGGVTSYTNKSYGDVFIIGPTFANGTGQYNIFRIVVDGTEIHEVSVFLDQTNMTIWYKVND